MFALSLFLMVLDTRCDAATIFAYTFLLLGNNGDLELGAAN